ncbi:hypothetical protein [Pseudomonas sp. K2I15]|uniref:hypothetical protein n=1 Tax=unclassified Pseudomonas TaxID=196821 RepID=UPI000B4CB5DC|nr:hypothetical protein [Pseudomonas sp. K2I15]OWP73189.1 hypothetical protein CEC48_04085 [Pseudomonas sp. K2I15]
MTKHEAERLYLRAGVGDFIPARIPAVGVLDLLAWIVPVYSARDFTPSVSFIERDVGESGVMPMRLCIGMMTFS